MPKAKAIPFRVHLEVTDGGEVPPLHAYVFSAGGKLLGDAPLKDNTATVDIDPEFDGAPGEVVLGPPVEKGQPPLTASALRRAGAYSTAIRILAKEPRFELAVPSIVFPHFCICWVRGRLVKRFTLPDGTHVERPVCNARVTICEVDHIPLVIERLPEIDLVRLRDDLLDRLRVINWRVPPRPPEPDPPGPFPPVGAARRAVRTPSPDPAPFASSDAAALSGVHQLNIGALAATTSIHHMRRRLVDLADLIAIHICDLIYLWGYFHKDCLTTVYADEHGRFSTAIVYDCNDAPDLYFSVEQFDAGSWKSVYRPSIGCGTYWNYACGTEIVINVPGATACEEPEYDVPPGVTLFVLPFAIGSTPIWGIPPGAPPAPFGWVRADGKVDYATGSGLGSLYNAPFGHVLNFIHDDSYFIPSAGIRYYRYSFRPLSGTPNTGASDASWTPITFPLNRGYRMEYSGGGLPTYESYSVGPKTVGAQTGLFEFKPQVPPPRPTDPATVIVREWTSGNLSEVAASWNTLDAAPPLSVDNTTDDAGVFEVKIEVFDSAGSQVMPGASTFRFLARNADGTTTRLSTPAEEAGGAYVLRVHVDNNGTLADLPQPSIGGVAASDDCGFLRYEAGDEVLVRFLAAHPNDEAVFGFGITRGSNGLASASTLAPYVEVASATAPPYAKVGDYYENGFAPAELVGTCVNAAFAASLGVYGKATNGYSRLGIDASRLIAFALALAEEEGDD